MKNRLIAGACLAAQSFALCAWGASPQPSVYRINPALDASIIGGATMATLVPYLFASELIHPRCPCDPGEVNALDRGAIGNTNPFLDSLSDASAGAAVIAPILADYFDVGASPELVEDLTVYAEALTVNGAFVSLAKYTIQRPLPRVYAGQDPVLATQPGGYRSFYSGHTSLTFAALSASSVTLNLRHHSGVWPWVLTGAFGLGVAAERVAAGRHFYTDVAVGAVMGTLVGTLVPLFHDKTHDGKPSPLADLHLVPAPDGAQLIWTKNLS